MTQQQVDIMVSRMTSTLSYDDLSDVDMVVEAVIESIDVKQKIFTGMLKLCRPNIYSLGSAFLLENLF